MPKASKIVGVIAVSNEYTSKIIGQDVSICLLFGLYWKHWSQRFVGLILMSCAVDHNRHFQTFIARPSHLRRAIFVPSKWPV